MSFINGFIIFSLIVTVIYSVGLLTFLNDYDENKCEMTYMFEYPQYVKISQDIDEKYPKYSLYAYSEGHLTEKARNMYFDGIPVLFIPGNAGSHRQARSLASVALRKALNSRTPYHFDHFAIDVNNELSGLNGILLYDQLDYVNHSIYRILDLYKERKNPPKSVILYAHSVGGIVARRLVENLEDSNLVPIVLSLATPHQRPPLLLDSFIHNFYKGLNSTKVLNTTFISITGGYSDFLVPSFLTKLSYSDALNVATTQIPRSWLPADHVCIMWCKQTVMALNRALFDVVDPKTKQISTNPQFRESIFHHHLVHHNGLSPFLRNNYADSQANIRNQGEWIEYLARQYTVNVPRYTSSPNFYMIRLLDQPQYETVTVTAFNLESVDWAFVCGAHIPRGKSRVCEEFTHLSHLSEIVPSHYYKRRILTVNLHELMKTNPDWTHVVLRVLPNDEEVILNVDIYNTNERRIDVNLPHILSFKRQILIENTPEKVVHYELVLPNLYHIIQSYQLFVDAVECTNGMTQATATLTVPWANQNQHKQFLSNDSRPLHVRLYSSRPQWASNQSAVVQLNLDPRCRYKISIRSWFPGIISQLARFYSPLLIVNVAAVVLMTLNSQMKTIATDRDCSIFFVAIKEGAKPYYILTSVKLISRFLSFKSFTNYFPAPDWLIMSQEGTDFFLLPLMLYICSVGIVWLLSIVLSVALFVCETTVNKLALKFLAKTISFTISWSDYIMSGLHKLPCIVAAALICLSITTSGSLALAVGMVFYFMRLTQMSQDYIEGLVWYYIKKLKEKFKRSKPNEDNNRKEEKPSTSEDKNHKEPEKKDSSSNNNNNNEETPTHNAIFFHTTIFLIWCLVTVINVPSVLTWAHNFKYSRTLQPDPSFIPGLILSFCALPLWQLDFPKIERKGYKEIGQFINILAIVSLIYAPISVFRLNYILTAAVVVVVLHQLAAPNRDLRIETERQLRPDWLEAMKMKLE